MKYDLASLFGMRLWSNNFEKIQIQRKTVNTTRKLEMLWQQRIWNIRKNVYNTDSCLACCCSDSKSSKHDLLWPFSTLLYIRIIEKRIPPGRIRNSLPPYHISAKLYSPLYQICLFSVPPLKIHFPPHTEKMIGHLVLILQSYILKFSL